MAAPVRRAAIGARTRAWPAYSRLFVVGDGHEWAIADDVRQISLVAERLGIRTGPEAWVAAVRNQSIFYASHHGLFGTDWRRDDKRIGVAYLHGRPGIPGMPEEDVSYREFTRRHREIDRIQVTCRAMEELVLEVGAAPEKLFLIPIAIELELFPLRDVASRPAARRKLRLPDSAFVVGSFQKDGIGSRDGSKPKPMKGPDVLLAALERLHEQLPELWVLLTGHGRGYVRAGLERLGIPYRHGYPVGREGMAEAYHALDAYIVSSRDEGGPKAVLEAMATGVPLVTTRVGQAVDLVTSGSNGYLVDVEDAEGLAASAERIARAPVGELERLVEAARETAERHSYEALAPRWRELFTGFVDFAV